jgi:ribosomal protein L29
MNEKEKRELRALAPEVMQDRLEEAQRELFSLRLQAATKPVGDYKKFKKLRVTIARLKTYIRQQQQRQA